MNFPPSPIVRVRDEPYFVCQWTGHLIHHRYGFKPSAKSKRSAGAFEHPRYIWDWIQDDLKRRIDDEEERAKRLARAKGALERQFGCSMDDLAAGMPECPGLIVFDNESSIPPCEKACDRENKPKTKVTGEKRKTKKQTGAIYVPCDDNTETDEITQKNDIEALVTEKLGLPAILSRGGLFLVYSSGGSSVNSRASGLVGAKVHGNALLVPISNE